MHDHLATPPRPLTPGSVFGQCVTISGLVPTGRVLPYTRPDGSRGWFKVKELRCEVKWVWDGDEWMSYQDFRDLYERDIPSPGMAQMSDAQLERLAQCVSLDNPEHADTIKMIVSERRRRGHPHPTRGFVSKLCKTHQLLAEAQRASNVAQARKSRRLKGTKYTNDERQAYIEQYYTDDDGVRHLLA